METLIQKRGAGRTGPITPQGKALTSLNAMQHGLYCRTDRLLPGESVEQFELLVQGVFSDLLPVGTLEISEAWAIVGLLVRRQRCERFEAGAGHRSFELNAMEAKKVFGPTPPPVESVLANLSALPHMIFINKLFPVEAHISRQLDKCYRRLEKLQARRFRNAENEIPRTNFDASTLRSRILVHAELLEDNQ